MTSQCMRYLFLALAMSALCATPARAADWKPGKPVEFVVPAPAGGSLDRPARLVQKIWQENKLVDVPVNIINKLCSNREITSCGTVSGSVQTPLASNEIQLNPPQADAY